MILTRLAPPLLHYVIQRVNGDDSFMKSLIKIVLLLCCICWPASANLSDYQPIIQYSLPADIMRVDFGSETWVYRLFEDGTVKKLVNKRIVNKNILATSDELTQDTPSPKIS